MNLFARLKRARIHSHIIGQIGPEKVDRLAPKQIQALVCEPGVLIAGYIPEMMMGIDNLHWAVNPPSTVIREPVMNEASDELIK